MVSSKKKKGAVRSEGRCCSGQLLGRCTTSRSLPCVNVVDNYVDDSKTVAFSGELVRSVCDCYG